MYSNGGDSYTEIFPEKVKFYSKKYTEVEAIQKSWQ